VDDSQAASTIRKTIGLEAKKRQGALPWIIVGVVVVALGVIVAVSLRGGGNELRFTLGKVEQGSLTVLVTAVGELAPLNQIDVGTEVSGTIEEVLVDNNDRVTAGQLLARLDTDQLEAQVRRANATLLSAQARVGEAEATIAEARRTLRRTTELQDRGVATQDALDTAQSSYDRAVAGLDSANAQVEVSAADLATAQTSLSKAEIFSPVDGVVLDRKVDPGMTVVAAMQTPVLFTLAEDLAEMELKVAIDEADVGQVQVGQKATFTVDAYPNRRFDAEITRVRFAATAAEGVVTYETLLAVKNEDLSLRPGMTASTTITVATVEDALLVPNEALRFSPSEWGLGPLTGFEAEPEDEAAAEPAEREDESRPSVVWVLRAGDPVRIPVQMGATDGRMTVVTGADLAVGDELIIGLDEDR
jgi:HlyD family secretion protein